MTKIPAIFALILFVALFSFSAAAQDDSGDIAESLSKVLSNVPEGQMYYSVTYGKNKMGSYASQLNTEQRWMVIAYIKSKQAGAHSGGAAANSGAAAAPAAASGGAASGGADSTAKK